MANVHIPEKPINRTIDQYTILQYFSLKVVSKLLTPNDTLDRPGTERGHSASYSRS